jgi:hypothetical protein
MSTYFYGDDLNIGVPNPGCGELQLAADSHDPERPWERTLVGEQVGRFLTQLTALALTGQCPEPRTGLLPRDMTRDQAAVMLPKAQEAVVLAVAATERTERVFPGWVESPAAPICVNCSEGSVYAGYEAVSAWCTRYGHSPFGWPTGTTWQQALDRHTERVARWQRAQDLEARP